MSRFRRNIVKTLPVMAGYIVLGIGFGIILQSRGFGVLWAFLMSLLIYAGSMQFMTVELFSSGAGLATIVLTTLMVNARHLFYGISMIDRYKDTGACKPYLIFSLTDETYSLVCSDSTMDKKDIFQISLLNHFYWIFGSVLGAILGNLIPFDFAGVDFALTALFVSIAAEQWTSCKDHLPAVIGIAASASCLLIFGSDKFLIPAMILITIFLTVLKFIRREGKSHD